MKPGIQFRNASGPIFHAPFHYVEHQFQLPNLRLVDRVAGAPATALCVACVASSFCGLEEQSQIGNICCRIYNSVDLQLASLRLALPCNQALGMQQVVNMALLFVAR